MRRTLITLAILGSLISPATTAAADNGTVAAEVTVTATPCITVGNAIDYGTLDFSTPAQNVFSPVQNTSYASCSSQAQRVYVRGTNGVSTSSAATWQLTTNAVSCPTAALNTYLHLIARPTDTTFTGLALTDQLFESAAAAGATQSLLARLRMPCSGSDGAGETMTFSIIFTASF